MDKIGRLKAPGKIVCKIKQTDFSENQGSRTLTACKIRLKIFSLSQWQQKTKIKFIFTLYQFSTVAWTPNLNRFNIILQCHSLNSVYSNTPCFPTGNKHEKVSCGIGCLWSFINHVNSSESLLWPVDWLSWPQYMFSLPIGRSYISHVFYWCVSLTNHVSLCFKQLYACSQIMSTFPSVFYGWTLKRCVIGGLLSEFDQSCVIFIWPVIC